jgi:hypothetical protein
VLTEGLPRVHGPRRRVRLIFMGAHSRKCDWCGCGTTIERDLQPVNVAYQYWCVECARALIIKGDPIEVYRELEGEPIYGRLLDEHCALKRFYSFASV